MNYLENKFQTARDYVARTILFVPVVASAHFAPVTPKLTYSDISLPGVPVAASSANSREVSEMPIELSVVAPNIERSEEEILSKLAQNPGLADVLERGFKQKDLIEDTKIYYPIWKAAADAKGVPLALVVSEHYVETGASRKIDNTSYVGAMQRDPRPGYYPNEYAYKAFYGSGLGYLEKVPGQRNPTDAQEIVTGASILRDLIDKHGSIPGALEHYGSNLNYRLTAYYAFAQVFN